MKLNEVLLAQLDEGYTLKKISMSKWNHDDSHELDSVEDEDDYGWESEPPRVAKSSHKVYSILDTKTNKEVGKAELDSNDVHGDYGSLQGTFLGKKFSIQVAQRNSDPQKLFNKFVKWPSTKKKWGKLLESDDQKLYVYSKTKPKLKAKGFGRQEWDLKGYTKPLIGTKDEIQEKLRKEFPSKTIIISYSTRKK